MRPGDGQPLIAGVVAGIVGFAAAFTVVLQGLRGVGATADEAASGLLVLCLAVGVVAVALAWRTRMPVAIAWSTPGAALLITAGPVEGGWPAAVGAFLLAAALTVAAGLWAPFGRAIARIPAPLASGLLAGVLLPICLAPAQAATELPSLALPVIAVWALLLLVARRWAVPGALAAAAVAVAVSGDLAPGWGDDPLPVLTWTTPSFHLGTLVGLGLPLFLVTMASQNLTGMSVLALHGFRPQLPPVLVATGAASAAGAPFGAHGINLAAITAALSASPDAHPDPSRRWIASAAAGGFTAVLGLSAGLVTAVLAASPPLLVRTVAGLALVGALTAALAAATAEEDAREAAVVTFVVSASGIAVAGISAPFWGLAAGLTLLALQRGSQLRAARAVP